MAHCAERPDCPVARLERALGHNAPSLDVIRRGPAQGAARAQERVSQLR